MGGRRADHVGSLAAGPQLTDGEKSLVSMGAYLVVFPDKIYLNTKDPSDYGSLECRKTTASEWASACAMRRNGLR